jgi:hypothetical protein
MVLDLQKTNFFCEIENKKKRLLKKLELLLELLLLLIVLELEIEKTILNSLIYELLETGKQNRLKKEQTKMNKHLAKAYQNNK